MAAHFHRLKIKDLRKETEDSVVLTLEVPEDEKDLFHFTQGQNLTLKTILNGEELRRSYSICSAPFENKLCIAIKKAPNGKFSHHANEYLQIGDIIETLPPTGRFFTSLVASNKKNYLAIAAGSGITPIISIIKATLATEPLSTFTLVYGNQTRSSIMFFEELEGLKNKYIDRFNFINILSREKTESTIHYGRIDAGKLAALSGLIPYNSLDEIFVCGPEPMLYCAKDFLVQQEVPSKNIHFERFNTPGETLGVTPVERQAENPLSTSEVWIKLDGRSFYFDLAYDNESILEGALKTGADVPYACKGGVCSTCRAKLLEGKVYMDNNYALEQEEVENGYILTCQSHPVSKKVVVDYDLR